MIDSRKITTVTPKKSRDIEMHLNIIKSIWTI